MFKMAVQRGRSKRRGDAYSEYVEPLSDARTKLADILNILLGLLRGDPLLVQSVHVDGNVEFF